MKTESTAPASDKIPAVKIQVGYQIGDLEPAQALIDLAVKAEGIADALDLTGERGALALRETAVDVRVAADLIANGDGWAARPFLIALYCGAARRLKVAKRQNDAWTYERNKGAVRLCLDAVLIARKTPREPAQEIDVTVLPKLCDTTRKGIATWGTGANGRWSHPSYVNAWEMPGDRIYMEGVDREHGAFLTRCLKGPDREAVAIRLARRWAALLEALVRCEERARATAQNAA